MTDRPKIWTGVAGALCAAIGVVLTTGGFVFRHELGKSAGPGASPPSGFFDFALESIVEPLHDVTHDGQQPSPAELAGFAQTCGLVAIVAGVVVALFGFVLLRPLLRPRHGVT